MDFLYKNKQLNKQARDGAQPNANNMRTNHELLQNNLS